MSLRRVWLNLNLIRSHGDCRNSRSLAQNGGDKSLGGGGERTDVEVFGGDDLMGFGLDLDFELLFGWELFFVFDLRNLSLFGDHFFGNQNDGLGI